MVVIYMKEILMIFLLILLLVCELKSSQEVYYVIDDDHNNPCPSDGGAPCHSLSDYANSSWIGVQNVTFILMEGQHTLNTTFNLTNLDRVTLIGQGQWINGSQWPAMESTVVIRCSDTSFLAFYLSFLTMVKFENVMITQCNSGLNIYDAKTVHVNNVSIQYMDRDGFIFLYSSSTNKSSLYFTNSSLHYNCLKATHQDTCSHAKIKRNYSDVYTIGTYSINRVLFSSGLYLKAPLIINTLGSSKPKYSKWNINNCFFYNNTATVSGGINFEVVVRFIIISFELNLDNTIFLNNSALIDRKQYDNKSAGALVLSVLSITNVSVQINNCTFENNQGMTAGALYLDLTCSMKKSCFIIRSTKFSFNFGHQGFIIAIRISGTMLLNGVYIASNRYNDQLLPATYSALYIYCTTTYQYVVIHNVTIYNNNMSGVISMGCFLKFHKSLIANNSSPLDGGGVWIDKRSKIKAFSTNFTNNTAARYGGAIYSELNIFRYPIELNNLAVEICQFRIPSVHASASVKSYFHNNKANIVGDNVFGGKVDGCLKGINVKPKVNFSDLIICNQTDLILGPSHYSISSMPCGVCFCNNNKDIQCLQRSIGISAYPGQWINLSLVTVGNCGGISPGVLLTKSHGLNLTLGNSNQQTSKTCTVFHYHLKQTHSNTGHFILTTGEFNIEKFPFTVNIYFSQCPNGFELSDSICICDDVIRSIDDITCNISTNDNLITRSGNNWLFYSHQHNCTIAYKNCPFDYCNTSTISLSLDNPDVQCSFNRSGILCGQCPPGLSIMLGSNRCGSCSNYYLFLIPVFIIAGLGLITILLTLNLTTSMGTINGLLFYANIMKLNEPVIFSNNHIPVLYQLIAWLNLDFGFDVCFFNGLDGYWKTWLQYIFSLTLILFIIVCCKFSGKLSRLFGKNVINALSTLIFMANTKLLLTIRNALMISPIECNDTVLYVWSVDGNINYLSGKHIPLVIVSLLFLLISLIYTVMIFFTQWLQKYGGRYCRSSLDPYIRLQPFIDAELGPYKDKYRYYRGIHLMIYLTLTAVFSYTTGTIPYLNNYITAFVSFTLLPFIKGKHKSKINTCLEFFFIFNLGVTSLLSIMDYPLMTYVITVISICLSLIVLIGILLYHIVIVIDSKCGNKLKCFKQSNATTSENLLVPMLVGGEGELTMEGSPAHVVNKRESLIYDIDI